MQDLTHTQHPGSLKEEEEKILEGTSKLTEGTISKDRGKQAETPKKNKAKQNSVSNYTTTESIRFGGPETNITKCEQEHWAGQNRTVS